MNPAADRPMKTVDEHLATVLSGIGPLASLELTLLDAHGCALAEDAAATPALPPFDNAAMEGYAVRAADGAPATESARVTLPVVGDIGGGSVTPYSVQPG